MAQTYSLAGLYADSVIRRERTFAQVPRIMKEKVREILIEQGYENLVTE